MYIITAEKIHKKLLVVVAKGEKGEFQLGRKVYISIHGLLSRLNLSLFFI